jgi:hypothetical protein
MTAVFIGELLSRVSGTPLTAAVLIITTAIATAVVLRALAQPLHELPAVIAAWRHGQPNGCSSAEERDVTPPGPPHHDARLAPEQSCRPNGHIPNIARPSAVAHRSYRASSPAADALETRLADTPLDLTRRHH